MDAIKFKRTQIHFLSDVFTAVVVVVARVSSESTTIARTAGVRVRGRAGGGGGCGDMRLGIKAHENMNLVYYVLPCHTSVPTPVDFNVQERIVGHYLPLFYH